MDEFLADGFGASLPFWNAPLALGCTKEQQEVELAVKAEEVVDFLFHRARQLNARSEVTEAGFLRQLKLARDERVGGSWQNRSLEMTREQKLRLGWLEDCERIRNQLLLTNEADVDRIEKNTQTEARKILQNEVLHYPSQVLDSRENSKLEVIKHLSLILIEMRPLSFQRRAVELLEWISRTESGNILTVEASIPESSIDVNTMKPWRMFSLHVRVAPWRETMPPTDSEFLIIPRMFFSTVPYVGYSTVGELKRSIEAEGFILRRLFAALAELPYLGNHVAV